VAKFGYLCTDEQEREIGYIMRDILNFLIKNNYIKQEDIDMGYLKYKGYTGSVEYSEEDKCLFGKVQGMSKDSITYEGQTVEELTADFEGAVDDYLALCEEKGVQPRKPYTGVLNVRLTPEIHSGAAMAASKAGITINAFIKNAVAKALGLAL